MYTDDRFSTPPLNAKFALVKPLNSDTLIIRYLLWTDPEDSALRKYYNDPLIGVNWSDSNSVLNAQPGSVDSSRDWRSRTRNWNHPTDSAVPGGAGAGANENYDQKIDKYFLISRYCYFHHHLRQFQHQRKGGRSAAEQYCRGFSFFGRCV